MQTLAVGGGQGAEFVVAVQEVADRAQGDDNAAAGQLLVDLRDAAMLGVAEASDQGQHIQAKLVAGKGQEGFGFRAERAVVAGAVGVGTAADAQGQTLDAVEGGNGAIVGVVIPEEMAAFRAESRRGREGQRVRGTRSAAGAWHGSASSSSLPLLFYSASPARFATL